MARIPVIAGNWKMYKTPAEGEAFVRALGGPPGNRGARVRSWWHRRSRVWPLRCTPSQGTGIAVAAQNVFWEEQGAFTGEVAPGMLAALGVRWVIIGHSERRQLFGETDEGVARKVRAASSTADCAPSCAWARPRRSGRRDSPRNVLGRQVAKGLAEVRPSEAAGPRRGLRAGVGHRHRQDGHPGDGAGGHRASSVRRVAEAFGERGRRSVRILYGGSVKPDNVGDLMARPDIDGALVGGASLDVDSFAAHRGVPR